MSNTSEFVALYCIAGQLVAEPAVFIDESGCDYIRYSRYVEGMQIPVGTKHDELKPFFVDICAVSEVLALADRLRPSA